MPYPHRSVLRAGLAAVAIGVLVSGCSFLGPSPSASSEPAATPSGGVVSADPDAQGATAVGIDLSNQPAAIASVTVPYSGDERIENVKVDLIELRHRDKLMYGIFRVTAQGDYAETLSLYSILGDTSWEPSVLDMKNLKEYRPLSELTTGQFSEAAAGQPIYVHAGWAYPEGAETVDIRISGGFPLLEGVPVP